MVLETPRLTLRPVVADDADGLPKWHAGWAVVLKEDGRFIGFVNYHHREPWFRHRIEATIEPENTASIRLAERLGFRREGLLRDRHLVEGRYRSVAMFALFPDDLR